MRPNRSCGDAQRDWETADGDRRAAITLVTAAVEGVAHLTTDSPPAIRAWMSFRTHNRLATAYGAVVMALALLAPSLSREGRWALCALGAMPIARATMSDTREPQAPPPPVGEPDGSRNRAAGSSSYIR